MKECGETCGGRAWRCPRAKFKRETVVGPKDCSIAYPRQYHKVGPIRIRRSGRHILQVRIE